MYFLRGYNANFGSYLLRCRLPGEPTNASYLLPAEVLNSSFPWDAKNKRHASCSMIVNKTEILCDSFIYDDSKYESSAVIEVRIYFVIYYQSLREHLIHLGVITFYYCLHNYFFVVGHGMQ